MPLNIAFLCDPLDGFQIEKDTTFALMLSAQARGHRVFYLPADGLVVWPDGCRATVQELRVTDSVDAPFEILSDRVMVATDLDAICVRLDPPFDQRYLRLTQLLDLIADQVVVCNAPAGLRAVNEKLWALQFDTFIPPTLVTASLDDFHSFLAKQKRCVIKPTDGFGGQGIFKLSVADSNAAVAFEQLSANHTQPVIVQGYVPEADVGDKRVLVCNSDILGAVLRVHKPGEHRNNVFAGGTVEPIEVTAHERAIIAHLSPHFQALELAFVGLDFLGDRLIEVNVTSPTCLRELSAFVGRDMGQSVIEFIEMRIRK